jgi:hypothetical protein
MVSSEAVLGEGALDLLVDGPPVETHMAVKAAVGDVRSTSPSSLSRTAASAC